jgi:hypothetical protein
MCSRERLPFLLVKDQPRQSTSRPGSILDCRGGDESTESSNVKALGRCVAVPNGQGGEQPGGPQQQGMSAAPKWTTPREAVCGITCGEPSLDSQGEGRSRRGRTGQVHPRNRRRRGRSTPGKKGRPKAGRFPRPAVDGASGEDISHKAIAEREMGGAGIGAWARSSVEGG